MTYQANVYVNDHSVAMRTSCNIDKLRINALTLLETEGSGAYVEIVDLKEGNVLNMFRKVAAE